MLFVIDDFISQGSPMGVKVSKHSTSKRGANSLSSNVSSERSSSIIESMKPECLKKRKTKKKRRLTLEDWLLASPGSKGLNPDCFTGGELYVLKQFSKRVHQSSFREHKAAFSTPGDSFYLDLCSDDVSRSSFKRSQSGKLKKKVSFKLPEEGDIVIFYSPAQSFESDPQSF